MKTEKRERARFLRSSEGWSMKKIASELNVSKSSVSLWVRDIDLTEDQKKELTKNKIGGSLNIDKIIRKKRNDRITQHNDGKNRAKELNWLHAFGCALYWGEGSKDRNSVKISNSDLYLLLIFKRFLFECFGISNEDIMLRIQCYDDIHSVEEIENYWLRNLEIPRSCIRKTTINKVSPYSTEKRAGKLEWGTCTIEVHSTDIIQSIYGSLKEYANFDNRKCMK